MSGEIRAITMPKWGLAMEEGMVAAWHVDEGGAVKSGDEVMDIETSKITNVYEATETGVLRRRVVPEGETGPVGALLGVIADTDVADADIDAFVAAFQAEFAVAAKESAAAAPAPETVEAGGRRKEMKAVLAMLVADESLVSRDMVNDVLKFKRLDGVDAALRAIADGRQGNLLTDRLGDLATPAQAVWGRQDRILPPAPLPANVPAHLVDAGHLPHMEAAAEVNRLLADLLGYSRRPGHRRRRRRAAMPARPRPNRASVDGSGTAATVPKRKLS